MPATRTLPDFRGRPIAEGDRILPTCWGGSLPLWLCNSKATVIGVGRTRIKVRFDGVMYDDALPYHAIPADYVRRLTEDQV